MILECDFEFNPNLDGGGGGNFNTTPPSTPTMETVKAVTLAFVALPNISLEAFVPNLVSLTCPVPR